ncbi:protein ROOT INITIATION DEFECTIVE 3-like [Camellia sinensis]|uniref:protein ROOT INITIATION DEFECTIVE 3-like n=1 Tax=Camellia sinensis TaxID=4442 RepID=UPI001036DEB1|nr:protein ROOT INITIATION DEFECTIVE 3-like [Camellia sinensis]XP_028125118.1 protein ROOT INITIATION DEFECTIVE 3-like [Camellia sinensis]XP_028125119.1 protein ROOT INITIATION DEFECTIVE 3-like [Camellia sinensis]XP_028125120.1 protein ROOT INITIATION DEFECTIVE 3-like [Camellia sinensis]
MVKLADFGLARTFDVPLRTYTGNRKGLQKAQRRSQKISNGRLVRTWCAHQKSVTCLTFSSDDSFLISGSEDGMIIIWPMIGLVDETNCWTVALKLNFSLELSSSITGLLTASSGSSSIFLSNSLDGTCKVWGPCYWKTFYKLELFYYQLLQ